MKDRFNVEAQILPEENEIEQWKPAPGFEDRYEISSFGRLRHRITKRQRVIGYDNGGYPKVTLRKDKKVYCVYIHRLVCEAFNGEPTEEKRICDHIDRCIINNYYKNLRWTDYSGNSLNHKPIKKKTITIKDTPIVFLDLDGRFQQRFTSILEAHEVLNLSVQQIAHNLLGQRKPFKNGYFRTEKEYLASIDKK